MRKTIRVMSAISFFAVTPLAAASWVPVECSTRATEIAEIRGEGVREREWIDHRRQVLRAAPDTSLYAPKPYPVTEDDILENFRYAYFEKLFDQGPESLDPREQRIYHGVQDGTVRVEILRVENWRVSRCLTHRSMPFFYVLRLFDGDEELSRFVLHHTGLMSRYVQVTDVATEALPALEDLSSEIQRTFGIDLPVESSQYVTADGLPLHCGPTAPCVAFRSGGETYVLDRGALLYRVDSTDALSVAAQTAQIRARGPAPVDSEAPVVSVGYEWRRAVLVGRDEAREARQTGRSSG